MGKVSKIKRAVRRNPTLWFENRGYWWNGRWCPPCNSDNKRTNGRAKGATMGWVDASGKPLPAAYTRQQRERYARSGARRGWVPAPTSFGQSNAYQKVVRDTLRRLGYYNIR